MTGSPHWMTHVPSSTVTQSPRFYRDTRALYIFSRWDRGARLWEDSQRKISSSHADPYTPYECYSTLDCL